MNVMPDVQATLREYLLTVPEIVAIFDQRIHGRLPETKAYPLLRMHIAPGGSMRVRGRVVRTVFDLHTYADPTSETPDVDAGNHARVVHAAVLACGGYVSATHGAVLLDADDLLAPFDLPDTSGERDEPLARYLSTVAVHSRPNP